MSLKYGASSDFCLSLEDVDTLVHFAKQEDANDNQDNRILFLKLAIVAMVTKFQVFVEAILREFLYDLKQNKIKYDKIPIYMRLNSLKIISHDYDLSKKLNNQDAYKNKLYQKINSHICVLNKHYSSKEMEKEFCLKTSFPLGRTGKEELLKLFMQFEGKDIFQIKKLDIDKIDSLFLKRHLIVHQDRCDQLTEEDVLKDQHYLKTLAKHIDRYLENKLKQYKNHLTTHYT